MSSKIKVDSIETVSGSGTISIPTGNNLSVAGTSTLTGAVTAADIRATTIKSSTGNTAATIANNGTVTFASNPVGITFNQVKLLDVTISSAVAYYDITSTYINATYNDYFIIFSFKPATDSVYLRSQVYMGGVLQTGAIYAYEMGSGVHGSTNSNGNDYFMYTHNPTGNSTGEYVGGKINLTNVNDTNFCFNYSGKINMMSTGGSHAGYNAFGSLTNTQASSVVNGFRFYFSSGNITNGTIKVYGVA